MAATPGAGAFRGATGGTAAATPGAGAFQGAGDGRTAPRRPGANVGAEPAGALRADAMAPWPASAESRAASAAATSSWTSKRSATSPSTRVPNSTAPVATSTIRVVMRTASPTRCRVPSTIHATPWRR